MNHRDIGHGDIHRCNVHHYILHMLDRTEHHILHIADIFEDFVLGFLLQSIDVFQVSPFLLWALRLFLL
jgi:hypothetical protein